MKTTYVRLSLSLSHSQSHSSRYLILLFVCLSVEENDAAAVKAAVSLSFVTTNVSSFAFLLRPLLDLFAITVVRHVLHTSLNHAPTRDK